MAIPSQVEEVEGHVVVHRHDTRLILRSLPSRIDYSDMRRLSPIQDVIPRSHNVPIDDSILSALIYRCEAGDLAEAKNIARIYDIDSEDIRMRSNAAFYGACYNDRLHVAIWLSTEFGLSPQDARSANNRSLKKACMQGGLEIVQWLVVTFGLTRRDMLFFLNNQALRHIFSSYPKARWLHETFRFTREEVLNSDSHVNVFAIGSLAFVQWFAQAFEISVEDVRKNDCELLRGAASDGNFSVVKWLIEAFELTADDIKLMDNEVFAEACYMGDLDIVQWLAERYQLTADDARARDNFALRTACALDKLSTVQWLIEHFGLAAENMHGSDHNDMLRNISEGSTADAAQWMVNRFGAETMPPWIHDHILAAAEQDE